MTAFSSSFKQPSSSKSSIQKVQKKPSTKKDANWTGNKRPCNGNWLDSAAHLRKVAALNLEKSKKTQKERDSEVFVFPVDKSGVYNDKINGTWYTLDTQGMNRAPVCDLPFWDEYFKEKRTWSTLDERAKEITSHQHLVDNGEM
jgi:hypothetical protein